MSITNLFFYEKFRFKSNLSQNKIKDKLDSVLEPFGFLKWFPVQDFVGKIEGNEFKIIRNRFVDRTSLDSRWSDRTSFMPLIIGKIEKNSLIKIKLRIGFSVAIIMTAMFLLLLFAGMAQYLKTNSLLYSFWPLMPLALFYVIALLNFKKEVIKSKRAIIKLFSEK